MLPQKRPVTTKITTHLYIQYTVFGSKRIPTNQPKKSLPNWHTGGFHPKVCATVIPNSTPTASQTDDPAIPRLENPFTNGEPWLWADARCPTRSKAQSCPSPTSCLSSMRCFDDSTAFFSGFSICGSLKEQTKVVKWSPVYMCNPGPSCSSWRKWLLDTGFRTWKCGNWHVNFISLLDHNLHQSFIWLHLIIKESPSVIQNTICIPEVA